MDMKKFISEIPDNVPKMSKPEVRHYLKRCKQVYLHSMFDDTILDRLLILMPYLDTQQVKNGMYLDNGMFQKYVDSLPNHKPMVIFSMDEENPANFLFWAKYYYPKLFKQFIHLLNFGIKTYYEKSIMKQFTDDSKLGMLINQYFNVLDAL